MTSGVARVALVAAAVSVVWYALERTPPSAPRPAELLDASRAIASWTRPDTMESGETFERVLRRSGLDGASIQAVIQAASAVRDMRRMPAGMAMDFISDTAGASPNEIVLRLDVDHRLRIARVDSSTWRATEERLPWTTDTVVVRGVVRTSLYDAFSDAADMLFRGNSRQQLVWEIARVYEYRVEMNYELRQGDSVTALVERLRGPEETTRVRSVLAAKLDVGGKPIAAFLFPDTSGPPKHYDEGGKSMITTFLRSPLDFPRITSRYTNSRLHPILKTWRAHRGTDYGASTGTEVLSVADGTVIRAVYNPGGYGNVVDVRHRNGLITRYAHLRAFAAGIRTGVRVLQRQVLGFVGSTGLATAPHLHFEVLVSGQQENPIYALPRTDGNPLPTRDRPVFDRARTELQQLLSQPEGVVRAPQLPPPRG